MEKVQEVLPPAPIAIHSPTLPAKLFRIGRLAFWICSATLVALWFAATLDWPFGRDQGILAWVGDAVFRGGMPYRDAWEVKGPVAILPYTFMEWIFGPTMRGVRVLDLILSLGNLAAIYFITREWWDRQAAIYAVAIGAMVAATLDFWVTAQPDYWCGYLIAWSIVLMGAGVRSVKLLRLAAAAACLGTCVMQKPIYLMCVVLFVPALVWARRDHKTWRTLGVLALAFCAPIAALVLWFVKRGALGPFLNTFILFNLRGHSQIGAYMPHQQFMMFVSTAAALVPFGTCILPALIGGLLLSRTSKWPGAVFWIWLALGFAFVVVQKKYFLYHWGPVTVPVVIGTAIAVRQAKELLLPLPRSWNVPLSAGHVALCWLALLYLPISYHWVRDWVAFRAGAWTRAQYEANFVFQNKSYYWFSRIRLISDYVSSHTTDGQYVLIWGFDPGINYLTRRPAPTRFGYSYPLELGRQNPYEDEYRAEFMRDVQQHRPTYIVVANQDQNLLVGGTSERIFEQFTPFHDFVEQNYRIDKQIDDWTLWRKSE